MDNKILIVLLIGLVAHSHAFPRIKNLLPRIVGGEEVQVGEIPHQISLQYQGYHVCGGSILNDNWIVTAAHCAFSSAPSFSVRVGVHNIESPNQDPLPLSQVLNVARVIIHPDYDGNTVRNDIALMQLQGRLVLNKESRTAAIPLVSSGIEVTGNVTVSGWGTLESGGEQPAKLHKVVVPVVSDFICRLSYGKEEIADSMICAGLREGGKDSCQGDSGGPLTTVIDGVTTLAGIVSWGEGCAFPKYYGVYTEVSYFSNWVAEQIAS